MPELLSEEEESKRYAQDCRRQQPPVGAASRAARSVLGSGVGRRSALAGQSIDAAGGDVLLVLAAVDVLRQRDGILGLVKDDEGAAQEGVTEKGHPGAVGGAGAQDAGLVVGVPDELVEGDLDGDGAEGEVDAAALAPLRAGDDVEPARRVVLAPEITGYGRHERHGQIAERGPGVEHDGHIASGVRLAGAARGEGHGCHLDPVAVDLPFALGAEDGVAHEIAGELFGVDAAEDDDAAVGRIDAPQRYAEGLAVGGLLQRELVDEVVVVQVRPLAVPEAQDAFVQLDAVIGHAKLNVLQADAAAPELNVVCHILDLHLPFSVRDEIAG